MIGIIANDIANKLASTYPPNFESSQDIGDLGNEIGIVIAKYLSNESGNELWDFIAGIEHGVSLEDGTHG